MTDPGSDVLYIVDGSGFIFRAYHALPPLTTRAGVPSGAVYGFTQMLIKLELAERPSHLVVVFDAGAHSFRNDLYAEYKANRTEPPDDLKPQFATVRKMVEAFGVPMLELRGYEADDIIATLVRKAREKKQRVVIVSSDKDLMQLVGDDCRLLDTMKNTPQGFFYGAAEVVGKFGVAPEQLGDVLALMGDSVDNVPGVPGVGPKTASALVAHFGSLDALLSRLEEVPAIKGLRGAQSVAEKLKVNVDALRLSRKLVALDDAVPVAVEIEALRRQEPDMARVESALREFEFERLLERMQPAKVGSAPLAPPVVPVVRLARPEVRVLTDANELSSAVAAFSGAAEIAITFQTASPPLVLVGVALSCAEAAPIYVPIAHRYLGAPSQLGLVRGLELMRPLLESPTPRKHVYDVKQAELVLLAHGIHLNGVVCDPMIAAYLFDPTRAQELAALATEQLTETIGDRAALLSTSKKKLLFDSLEIARAAAFSAVEAEATLRVGQKMRDALEAQELTKLFDDLELPLARVLAVMERKGIELDVEMLRKLSIELDQELQAIEREVQAVAGSEINLASPKQLQELLFEKLALPPVRKTKTGFSTDADVLETLAPLHPVAAKIAEHRLLAKLKGTYVDALPLLVDAHTGRLHTSYEQTVAATGRLSSVNPNLQNVPIRTEHGLKIRHAFVAARGKLLVAGDYSQIELRMLAHLSKDPVLTDAFHQSEDIHRRTVIEMFGADRADEPELRRAAKMINYGIVYGLSDFGLADRLGIDRGDAKRYIEQYSKTYARVAAYMSELVELARREGGARTMLGRFRPLPELRASNRNVRLAAERMAKNTPLQGSAADLIKLAMLGVDRMLTQEFPEAAMLLTVHDELVLEAPKAQATAVAARLVTVMEQVMQLSVPLKVDVGIGPTWADCK